MNDRQLKIAIGGMLHDIGKVIYRGFDGRNHSLSGYEFLKDEIGIKDKEILDQVRYHHGAMLKEAGLPEDSLAYITYMADNIAAAADRREQPGDGTGFDRNMALDSIFNILNGNDEHFRYEPRTMKREDGINFPQEGELSYSDSFYQLVMSDMKDVLKNLSYTEAYLNSLLETMEACLTYIPSSTSRKERADISLYDHVKLTAAIGNCIYAFLEEKGIKDYQNCLFKNAGTFYDEDVFLMYSMDMSGIQAFIYNIQSKDALKNLRSRSFYLEIMLENMVDEICRRAGVSRANLIYSGGGHAYLLLPNTEKVVRELETFGQMMNGWFLERFQTELFTAAGYALCSANALHNMPEGSYQKIFNEISGNISKEKRHRYSASGMMYLNTLKRESGIRECRICHRSDHLTGDEGNICQICNGFLKLSKDILQKDFFSIADSDPSCRGIPVAKDQYMIPEKSRELQQRMKEQQGYIRTYCKNRMYVGYEVATKLWVGDYRSADTFEELVQAGRGIRRLGVLRADIDDLGQAFVRGFESERYGSRYVSLSRTATFSRKLSLFFKLHINDILKKGIYSLDGKEAGARNGAIVYSGGDDVFIVGAWADILEFSVDFYYALKRYTQGTLTISAGMGLYPVSFPISVMADQTGELEDAAKRMDGKNAIALFDDQNVYHWDIFIEKVLGEKFRVLYDFFESSSERGGNFLYNLLKLLRNIEEPINIARLAYLLARLEPNQDAGEDVRSAYRTFSQKLFAWAKDDTDRRQTITAIYIYVYLSRQEEEQSETDKAELCR